MVVVTYDEFGGQFDHVDAARQGGKTRGPSDSMGRARGSRRFILAPGLKRDFVVDHARTTRRRSWRRSSTASASRR
jgi:phospholipase C